MSSQRLQIQMLTKAWVRTKKKSHLKEYNSRNSGDCGELEYVCPIFKFNLKTNTVSATQNTSLEVEWDLGLEV